MVGSCDHLDPLSGCSSCACCGYRTDPECTNPSFLLRTKRYDISCCYDGAIIVSERFKDVCRSLNNSHLTFTQLPSAAGFYHLKCSIPVALNYESMGTVRSDLCPECMRYRNVIGYSHIALQDGACMASSDLRFSDWYFGSNNEASPLLIVGAAFTESAKATG